MYHVYAYRSGVVKIGRLVPPTACTIMSHTSRSRLRHAVDTCARFTRDGRTRLVPGVPEADNDDDDEIYAAMLLFEGHLRHCLNN